MVTQQQGAQFGLLKQTKQTLANDKANTC